MVLPATSSSVHHGAASSTTEASEARASVAKQSRPTSSPASDNSMDYTTPQRFRVKNVSLPEASNDAVSKAGDYAVTPSTVGPAETPDSVVPAENPVTTSSAENALSGAAGARGQQWGTAKSLGNDNSSAAAELALGGGAVSASERVKMNSRSCKNPHQQQPHHPHPAMTKNSSGASTTAFTQITPSIKLGPRITHGDGTRGKQDDGEMASPPPVMKLNMHRGQSGQGSFEELPSKKESSSLAPPPPAAAAPAAASIEHQNASQQKQQKSKGFKAEHQLPPPSFLAAKISPLRSKSSRAKKGDTKTRGKTPPPPASAAIAAASNADVSFFCNNICTF